ncbi:LysR family transcriptional regulator [uncultured Roseobacter sp.]|uniref:LysR family transcriptional regulator n=1 Tax=uncultured Roseobacter sp. TaxID=114847 RepID=UPI002617A485|nr:LysR family transcriptional regulator [uncultured Roseobacter sp.]
MNLKSLRAFLHVMDEGALVHASRRMNLSQPAVSRLVNLLEEEVGVKLFYRDQKTLMPTPEADLFYPEAQRIVASLNDLPDLFRQFRSSALVPLRIVSQLRPANGLVIPALERFTHRYPDVRTTLDFHGRRELGRRVQRDKFDLGFFVTPMQITAMDLLRKFDTELQVLLPRSHPLAGRETLTSDDLIGERYIALQRGLMARDAIDRVLSEEGFKLEAFHEVNSTNTALRLVASGCGFTFSDATVLDPMYRRSTVLVPWKPSVQIALGLFAPKNQPQHAATENFLACIEELWGEIVKTR